MFIGIDIQERLIIFWYILFFNEVLTAFSKFFLSLNLMVIYNPRWSFVSPAAPSIFSSMKIRLNSSLPNSVMISFIFDKNMITGYKSSPIDEGPDKFLLLFKERIIL